MAAELNSPQSLAALWIGLAFVASVLSIRLGISVALTEIVLGAIAGNLLGLEPNEWVNFLAALGSVLLTYLAGAEVEPWVLRARFRETVSIGLVAFAAPFLGAFLSWRNCSVAGLWWWRSWALPKGWRPSWMRPGRPWAGAWHCCGAWSLS